MNLDLSRWSCQKKDELRRAVEFLADKNIKTVLEIGTERGGTAYVWAQLVAPQNGRVVTVDHANWDWVYKGTPEEQRITQVIVDSHSPEGVDKIAAAMSGLKADFLFIDGDHTYPGVLKDFLAYSKLVRPGGFIGFHDILPTYDSPDGGWKLPLERFDLVQVSALWEMLRLKYPSHTFVDCSAIQYMFWGGIGIIEWEGSKCI